MRSIEVSARTINEAVSDGLLKLGCSISDCKVDIIQEGAKGLFGVFGSKPALVRLTLLEEDTNDSLGIDMLSTYSAREHSKWDRANTESKVQPVAAEGAREIKPRADQKPAAPKKTLQDIPIFQGKKPPQEIKPVSGNESVQQSKPTGEKKPPQRNQMRIAANPQVLDRPQAANAYKPQEMGKQQAAAKPNAPVKPGDKPPSRDVLERFKNAPLPDQQKADAAKTARPKKPRVVREEVRQRPERAENRQPMPAPENIVIHGADTPAGIAQSFLLGLTKRMGVDVQVDVRHDQEGHIFASMYGDTLGILIGRRGETLDALQYLTSLQVNKGQEEYIRCTLDTENYRAKREEALSRLASRMASRAVKTGRKVSLEPMNPYERRILHSSLQGNPNVTTHSEGDEPYRHVVVVPQKQ